MKHSLIVIPALAGMTTRLNRAGHIRSTAHWRFDHAMSIRTFGDMDGFTFIRCNGVMHQFLAALAASHCANTHPANFTFIKSHFHLANTGKKNSSSPDLIIIRHTDASRNDAQKIKKLHTKNRPLW
jgi:hypothetical protein